MLLLCWNKSHSLFHNEYVENEINIDGWYTNVVCATIVVDVDILPTTWLAWHRLFISQKLFSFLKPLHCKHYCFSSFDVVWLMWMACNAECNLCTSQTKHSHSNNNKKKSGNSLLLCIFCTFNWTSLVAKPNKNISLYVRFQSEKFA